MPKIDILLATYNGERYLKEQIDSIFRQSFSSWRVIAHDDGSCDRTLELLNKYATQYPDKFIVLNEGKKFGNPYDNFSYILSTSTSDYFAFCDQDDVWLENKLELFYDEMKKVEEKDKPVLIYSDLLVVDEKLNTIFDSMINAQKLPHSIISSHPDFIRVQNIITGCATLANKKCKEFYFPTNPDMRMHDWWLGLIVANKGICSKVEQPTIKYRQHSNNSVGFVESSFLKFLKKVSLKNIRKDFYAFNKMSKAFDGKEFSLFYYLYLKARVVHLRFLKGE